MTEKKKGRPFVYPFPGMEIGHKFHRAAHDIPVAKLKDRIHQAAVRFGKLNGQKFKVESDETGVTCLRIA